jgi:hypothetical protein
MFSRKLLFGSCGQAGISGSASSIKEQASSGSVCGRLPIVVIAKYGTKAIPDPHPEFRYVCLSLVTDPMDNVPLHVEDTTSISPPGVKRPITSFS